MSIPYDKSDSPPAPVLRVRLSTSDESPRVGPILAIVDTGSDGTLIPIRHLEMMEAINLGAAVLYGVLGDAIEVYLYEVDIWVEDVHLPGVVVIGDRRGSETILGRNILNKLVLLLDGPHNEMEISEQRARRKP